MEAHMRIEFVRTGGFAGMHVAATVDTTKLPPDEARALQANVDAARFFDLPPTIASPAPGADRFQYKIAVEAEGRRHTVELGEAAVPESLQPLIQQLIALARSARSG
jgi:emfourin